MNWRVSGGAIGLLIAGLIFGALAAFFQALRWFVFGFSLPWGTVLMLVCLIVVIRGAVEALDSRWGGWAMYAGWLLATIAFAAETPGGDLVISGGGRQVAYLFGGVILGAAAATVRPGPLSGRPTPQVSSSADASSA